LTDLDSLSLVGATVAITANFHSGQDILGFVNQNGITGSYNAVAGILTLNGASSVLNYEAALQSVTYFNSSDAPSADVRTISYTVDDGSLVNHASSPGNATITVVPVNDAPVLGGVPVGVSFANGPAMILAPGLTVSDVDGGTLTSATVHVGAGAFAGHGDVLSISAGGLAGTSISASYNAATETLTLTGTDTLAHYQQALESVAFQTTNFGIDHAQTIEWQLNDGAASHNLSALQTTAISLPRPPINDFNGDGFGDFLWQNVNGTPAVWLMNGTAVHQFGPPLPNPGPSWHAKDAADFDGDGMADILWQNDNGTPAVWLMNGTVPSAFGPPLPNAGPTWHVKAAADFDGDGKADILWQNDAGAPAVWLMNGTGLTAAGPALSNLGGASWHVIDAADFNGDGKADILWQNDNGTPAVWLMNGTTPGAVGPALANPGPTWHAKAAADFNGDGKADILWQNDAGAPMVWLMNGTAVDTMGPALAGPGPGWHFADVADFNGDGKADIVWQNDNGAPMVWLMDSTHVATTGPALAEPGSDWHIV
jgi:FG-GAP-like repeat